MYCTNCGESLEEGARECPRCGAGIPGSRPSKPRGTSKTAVAAVAVVAVLLVAVLAFSMMNGGGSDSGDSSSSDDGDSDDSSSSTYTADGSIVYSSGYDTYFSVSEGTNDSGNTTVTITLNSDIASSYTSFTWYVYNNSNPMWSMNSVTKTDAYAVWTISEGTYGDYTIGVICNGGGSSSGGGRGGWSPWNQQEYSMTATVDGTVTKTYSFTYDNESVSVSVSFDYSDYMAYAGTNGASSLVRSAYNDGSYSIVTQFIVVDDTVSDLEDALASAYEETYGLTASGQEYAEFILAFVQICYDYSYDSSLYGQSEYFAFPIETIYNGAGDCEDTSILCAALFTAAGYAAGVFVIPGHAIAAIYLEDYTAGDVASGYASSVALFTYTVDGKTYYGCETTLSSNSYGIGWIDTSYQSDGNGNVTYSGRTYTFAEDSYNLYLATTES